MSRPPVRAVPGDVKLDGEHFDVSAAEDVIGLHTLRLDGALVRWDTESPREPATRSDTPAAAKASLLQ
ncbi:MAG: hypothetical protein KA761_10565 [Gemmatimonadaceae bacterium]|nr:hypothetical protein [Gemmatimonadaceae bacterium]